MRKPLWGAGKSSRPGSSDPSSEIWTGWCPKRNRRPGRTVPDRAPTCFSRLRLAAGTPLASCRIFCMACLVLVFNPTELAGSHTRFDAPVSLHVRRGPRHATPQANLAAGLDARQRLRTMVTRPRMQSPGATMRPARGTVVPSPPCPLLGALRRIGNVRGASSGLPPEPWPIQRSQRLPLALAC